MTISIRSDAVVVFDLDDTLYKEIEFVHSAYQAIAKFAYQSLGINIYEEMLILLAKQACVFDVICERYGLSLQTLIDIYRFHEPTIALAEDARRFLTSLQKCGVPLGLLTDGRSLTQRNKIRALGIEHLFQPIVISEEIGSEKPSEQNYRIFAEAFPSRHLVYIADNVNKDFVTPNRLGWTTVRLLDDGRNIHSPTPMLPESYNACREIESFEEIVIDDGSQTTGSSQP